MWFSVGFADRVVVGFVGLHKMPAINSHPENRLFYGEMDIEQQQQQL